MKAREMILAAASLMSDDGENSEYDRAIAELVTYTLGLGSDDVAVVAVLLKGLQS